MGDFPAYQSDKSAEELREILKQEYENPVKFVDQMRAEFDYIFKKIDSHPFLKEIESGKLPREKCKTYYIQNYWYFVQGFKKIGAAIARAPDLQQVQIYSEWSRGIAPEYGKYLAIMKAFGITEEEMRAVVTDPRLPFPASHAYADYMFYICSTGSIGEVAAATLACPWTYSERAIGGLDCPMRVAVGVADSYGVDREIALAYGNYPTKQPHLAFLKSKKDIANYIAEKSDSETRLRMKDCFKRCLEYEYKWWDTAYRHDPRKDIEVGSYF